MTLRHKIKKHHQERFRKGETTRHQINKTEVEPLYRARYKEQERGEIKINNSPGNSETYHLLM